MECQVITAPPDPEAASREFASMSRNSCHPGTPITHQGDLGVQSLPETKVHGSNRTRSYRRLTALAAALMLTVAAVGPALGAEDKYPQPTKTKPSHRSATPQPEYDRVAAKQAYEEALRAFNLGHWQDAVTGFERSYTLSGDAALLFNVAQAQRQAGNVKEAIIAYKAFLREKPDTPHREMIEAKLKDLESGAEAMATSSTGPNSKVEPDRLTGIWEDPFERGREIQASPSRVPVPAPAETVPPVVTGGPSELAPIPPSGHPAMALEPQIDQGPTPVRNNASLDLSQQPAAQEEVAAPSTRWWLWTGIGAVVAAGVVTAVILSTRGPERDTSCPSGVNGCLPVGK